MNPDLLRYESEHVREEHDRLRGLLEVEEMAIRLLVRDLRAAVAGEPIQLPLSDGEEGDLAVIDHYLAEGAKEVFRLAFDAETQAAVGAEAA